MHSRQNIPEFIETERLVLRCPQRGDGAQYFQMMADTHEHIKPWFGSWAKNPPSQEQAEKIVLEAREKFLLGEELCYFVFTQSHNILVGRVMLTRIDWSVPKGMLGYWTRAGHQRMGFAKEFVRCMNAMAMEQLQFRRLELFIDPRNEASISFAGKLGYCLEGRLRNYSFDNFGEMKDYLVYSMTPADYIELLAFSGQCEIKDQQPAITIGSRVAAYSAV